jgi:hypothetical protein
LSRRIIGSDGFQDKGDVQIRTKMKRTEPQFVVCIRNGDYPASLELRKLYRVIPDPEAAKHNQIRVVDESGEDYFYPESYFVPVPLPQDAQRAVLRAT